MNSESLRILRWITERQGLGLVAAKRCLWTEPRLVSRTPAQAMHDLEAGRDVFLEDRTVKYVEGAHGRRGYEMESYQVPITSLADVQALGALFGVAEARTCADPDLVGALRCFESFTCRVHPDAIQALSPLTRDLNYRAAVNRFTAYQILHGKSYGPELEADYHPIADRQELLDLHPRPAPQAPPADHNLPLATWAEEVLHGIAFGFDPHGMRG